MLRQISNLIHSGRLRTTAATPRSKKPAILKNDPSLEIQNFLEMAISQLGTPQEDFFFIQIGAFDGREGDHLFDLVHRHNWRGILVEPQRQAFDTLKQNYSGLANLRFFNVAIGPTDGELTLYTRKNGSVPIASVSKHLLIKPGHSRSEVIGVQVPCWTFDRLLMEADAPPRIDLLQIDTEGFDFEIIRSIRFDRVKPAIIRYEHALLSEADRNACIGLLAGHGYRMLLEDRDTMAIFDTQAHRDLTGYGMDPAA
ncbi:MAG: FkbM family methyltransferase [Pirellulales bacterium]|nr:FkbM family methyltransferase [Pirellulales bacterium]